MGAENGCGVHPGGFVSWTGTIIERSANRTIWFRAEGSTAGGLSPLDGLDILTTSSLVSTCTECNGWCGGS